MWLVLRLLAIFPFCGSDPDIPKCCPFGQNVNMVKRQCSQNEAEDHPLELTPTSSPLSEGEFSSLCEKGDPQPLPIQGGTLLFSSQQDLDVGHHHCIDLASHENGSLTMMAWTCLSPPRCRHPACLEKCCPRNQVFGHDNQCRDVPDQEMLWTVDKVPEVMDGAVVRKSDILTRWHCSRSTHIKTSSPGATSTRSILTSTSGTSPLTED